MTRSVPSGDRASDRATRGRTRWLAVALVALWPLVASAEHRYAVVVSHDRGGPGTEPLLYAARDARKVAMVLEELGGFAASDIRIMVSPSAAAFEAALRDAERKLVTAAARDRGETLLLVYYSGHATSDALLLGDTRLPMSALRSFLARARVDVRLAFLDACQSGAITRLKGGVRGPSFISGRGARERARGYVVVTSSAANEASQESDDLRGSFFTHFLVSGLRGAADRSRDGKVTLGEVYEYVYHRTVDRTMGTMGGTQHPAYSFDLRGQGAVVLSRLRGMATLGFHCGRLCDFVVYDPERDLVVGEVLVPEGGTARLTVAPGTYVIKSRGRDGLYLQEISAPRGPVTMVPEHGFERVPFEEDVTKGPAGLLRARWGRAVSEYRIKVGYQAFFDVPTRRELFLPSGLVSGEVYVRNLVAPRLGLGVDLAFGRTDSTISPGPYHDPVAVRFNFGLAGVAMGYEVSASPVVFRAGPRLSLVYLSRSFPGDDTLPYQDLTTFSPGVWATAYGNLGWLGLGLEARAHYLKYTTESRDESLGFGEVYVFAGIGG